MEGRGVALDNVRSTAYNQQNMKPIPQPERRGAASTIYDVAQRATVSAATVSRMVNGSGYVGVKSRARIQEAMDALQYEPNALARSLKTKQSGLIALLLTDIANPFSAQVARGVQDVAQQAGFIPIICSIDNARMEREVVQALRRKRVDGIILTPTQSERSDENLQLLHTTCDRGIAMVTLGRPPVHPHIDEVSTDTLTGARMAVTHLAALGHRRIGFIGGQISLGVALGRLAGYRQGLAEANLPAELNLVREGSLDEESGRRETQALLRLANPPTAIFCVNDRTALGAMAEIVDQGLRIPEDISIVGFDDIPLAALVHPGLTTVRQPTNELGRLAATFLLDRIAHPGAPHQKSVLPCHIVVRQSSGPPPGVSTVFHVLIPGMTPGA
jgi:LacI family transcriptional regulator